MKIRLLCIRHGISCSNWLKYRKPWYEVWKRLIYTDPPLTNLGKALCRRQRARCTFTPQVDLFLCSPALRAQQTATLLFPTKHITVAPFTTENMPGVSNKPSTLSYQAEFLSSAQRAQLDYAAVIDPGGHFNASAMKSSLPAFMDWLSIHWPTLVSPTRLSGIRARQEVTIVLVCHSLSLRTLIPLKTSPHNLGVYEIYFQQELRQLIHRMPRNQTHYRLLVPGTDNKDIQEYQDQSGQGNANCQWR